MVAPRSRRSVLRNAGSAIAIITAGCTGASKSSKTDCTTEAVSKNENKVIQLSAVEPDSKKANLRVLLLTDVASTSKAHRIVVFQNDEKKFETEVDDTREHEFPVGNRPMEGQYRIVTYGRDGNVSDELEIEYQCNDG